MTPDLHPLVAELVALTSARGKTVHDLVGRIGCSRSTPFGWLNGTRIPTVVQAARWAAGVKHRLAVVGDDRVWAVGEEIADSLAAIREARGLRQVDVAVARGVSKPSISRQEWPTGAYKRLPPTIAYLTALGLRLALLEAS